MAQLYGQLLSRPLQPGGLLPDPPRNPVLLAYQVDHHSPQPLCDVRLELDLLFGVILVHSVQQNQYSLMDHIIQLGKPAEQPAGLNRNPAYQIGIPQHQGPLQLHIPRLLVAQQKGLIVHLVDRLLTSAGR